MISSFKVQHYKCLGTVDIPLTPIHVVIGQNDAGKSSLLEAMYALFRSSSFLLNEAFYGIWTGRQLVLETLREPEVLVGASWDDRYLGKCGYEVVCKFAPSGKSCMLSSEAFVRGNGERVEMPRNQDQTAARRYRSERHALAGQETLNAVCGTLRDAHMYRLDPRMMALPSALDVNRKFTMDVDGFGLASLLDDILGDDVESFRAIRETFCGLFPQFQSVKLQTEQAIRRASPQENLPHTGLATGKGIWFETHAGTLISAQQASAGAILILGFIALSHLPNAPRLLLIEEPENGIYPLRLHQVTEMLRKITEERGEDAAQIVMTTHSPYMLGFFQPEEATFMARQADGSVIARPMRDAPHIHERMGREFNLGELWYNVSEQDLFANA